jgi:hypothetical protein
MTIDEVIEAQRGVFDSYLYSSDIHTSYYGRAFRNYRDNQLIPEVYDHGYHDVLLDTSRHALCFFDILPDRDIEEVTIDIYFALNLEQLYGTLERDTETALADVVKYIRQAGYFKIIGISEGYESWSQWGLVKKEDNMHPFYLCRIRTNCKYTLNC